MQKKREKMIRDYLYEEKEKKTLTAKDIVSGIDFSTPQTKAKIVKKKFNSKLFLTCMSYVLVVLITSISFFSVVMMSKRQDDMDKIIEEKYILYNETYFYNNNVVSIYYKTIDTSKLFYISNSKSKKNGILEEFTITFDDKVLTIEPNEITYIATLEENEELEFDILYNGERRHCIIDNYN